MLTIEVPLTRGEVDALLGRGDGIEALEALLSAIAVLKAARAHDDLCRLRAARTA